jgi:hypothetical protein
MAVFSMCAAFGFADPQNNTCSLLEDTIRQGRFINHQGSVDIFTVGWSISFLRKTVKKWI